MRPYALRTHHASRTIAKLHTAYSVFDAPRVFANAVCTMHEQGAMIETQRASRKNPYSTMFFAKPDARQAPREGARFRRVPLCPLGGGAVAAFEFFPAAAWAEFVSADFWLIAMDRLGRRFIVLIRM